MQKMFLGIATLALVAAADLAAAGELKLTISAGRATLVAQDASVRDVLAEWARLGGTKIVNAEKLSGPPLTVQLVDRPEREVLDLVLRSASGYVAAPRAELAANLSIYDRIVILPTSVAPAYTPAAATQPTFVRPPMQQMVDDDPVEQQPNVGPGMPAGFVPPGGMPPPGMPAVPGADQEPQTMPVPGPAGQPTTAPRPGMLPQPQVNPPSPFTPLQPGVRPPGGTPN